MTSSIIGYGFSRASVTKVSLGAGTVSVKIPALNGNVIFDNVPFYGDNPSVNDDIIVGYLEGLKATPIAISIAGGSSLATSAAEGDIEGVTAGLGLSGGGTTGTVSLAFAPSELSSVTVATDDKVVIADTSDSDNPKHVTAQSIANLASVSPAGSDTQVQFNNSGSFGASSNMVFDGTNLDIAGLKIGGTAVTSTAAELNLVDGITAGTVSASLAVIVDSDKDITGFRNVTLTGELDAATLDISGDADIDGTTNLDVVDIDGAVDMASTLTVNGHTFLADHVQTGRTSFVVEPWSSSTIALGNFGSVGTQGSYRTALAWNYERDANSNFTHLNVNSYAQAGDFSIGNTGFLFNYDTDYASAHTTNPTAVANMTVDGQLNAIKGGADGGIVLGQTYSASYVGLRTAGMSETSGDEYIIMSNGGTTFVSAGTNGDVHIRGGANSTSCQIFLDTSENEINIDGELKTDDPITSTDLISTTNVIQANEFRASDYGPASDSSFTFVSDENLGMYRVGADALGLSANGLKFEVKNAYIRWHAALPVVTSYSTLRRGTYSGTSLVVGYDGSSRRYKENITNFVKSDWENIYNLQAVRFNWKEEVAADRHASWGLISEDVYAQIPELGVMRVVEGVNDGNPVPDTVNYEQLCVFLIEAVKDLNTRLAALE